MVSLADSASIVSYLSAASALFLSFLVVSAIARQRTRQTFRKHVLLSAVLLLVCAIISNVLIGIFIASASGDPQAAEGGIVLTKRLQATFDYLFGIAIGAFSVVATTPSIGSRRDFVRYMVEEFPNSYVFYVFVLAIGLVSIIVSPVTVVSTAPTIISFEPYVLFISGFAVMTIVLYATYRFITHLHRTNPGASIRRDTYLIILGISGFAIGELLFEVVLPNYGLDLRSPGFIVEMALVGLIAYGTRGRSFLQDLLEPTAEANLLTKPAFSLEAGLTYAIPERDATHAYEIFKDLDTHGAHGLCITRRSPKAVMAEYGLERTPVLWLSRVATEKNALRPSPPEKVAMAIEHFLELSENTAVLLDGLEYLVSHNDFGSILALLHDLNESVVMHEAILLVPFDPAVFNQREIALIRREVRFVGEMARELHPITKIPP